MKNTKNILLTLAASTLLVVPLATVISCSTGDNGNGDGGTVDPTKTNLIIKPKAITQIELVKAFGNAKDGIPAGVIRTFSEYDQKRTLTALQIAFEGQDLTMENLFRLELVRLNESGSGKLFNVELKLTSGNLSDYQINGKEAISSNATLSYFSTKDMEGSDKEGWINLKPEGLTQLFPATIAEEYNLQDKDGNFVEYNLEFEFDKVSYKNGYANGQNTYTPESGIVANNFNVKFDKNREDIMHYINKVKPQENIFFSNDNKDVFQIGGGIVNIYDLGKDLINGKDNLVTYLGSGLGGNNDVSLSLIWTSNGNINIEGGTVSSDVIRSTDPRWINRKFNPDYPGYFASINPKTTCKIRITKAI